MHELLWLLHESEMLVMQLMLRVIALSVMEVGQQTLVKHEKEYLSEIRYLVESYQCEISLDRKSQAKVELHQMMKVLQSILSSEFKTYLGRHTPIRIKNQSEQVGVKK